MSNVWIYTYAFITLVVFIFSLKVNKKLKSPILNPFILSLLLIIVILLTVDIPFKDYYEGNTLFNQLLGVSVVALAVPFYEQLPQFREHWKKISIIVCISVFLTMLSGIGLAILFGANKEIIIAIIPKSVTTAIAISIVNELGGNSALGAVSVAIAGITGSAFGIAILQCMKLHNVYAVGLSMGAVSHALGTARTMEYSIKAGSYASVALVLCGLLSSLIAPIIFNVIINFI